MAAEPLVRTSTAGSRSSRRSRRSRHSAELQSHPLAGHLGHLSPSQEAALQEFKTLINDDSLSQTITDDHGSDPRLDDAGLLRFLRARRWVVQDALKQFRDTEIWRKKNAIHELYDNIELHLYEETRRLYPQWTGRRDKRGYPVYMYQVSHLDQKTIDAYSKLFPAAPAEPKPTKAKDPKKADHPPTEPIVQARMLPLFALYENLTRFVLPLCAALPDRPNPETPITQSNNIVDISGVGLMQFWRLKGHMQAASTLSTAHYPETLDRIFIIGAPSFFPTVWGWIKKWFDPVTTAKIFILGAHEVLPTLESFIDRANIPKKFGGELDFNFGDMPILEPAIQNALSWEAGIDGGEKGKTFPKGPVKWVDIEGAEGKRDAVAVGSVDGKQRRDKVAVLTVPVPAKANSVVEGGNEKVDGAENVIAPPTAEIAAPVAV